MAIFVTADQISPDADPPGELVKLPLKPGRRIGSLLVITEGERNAIEALMQARAKMFDDIAKIANDALKALYRPVPSSPLAAKAAVEKLARVAVNAKGQHDRIAELIDRISALKRSELSLKVQNDALEEENREQAAQIERAKGMIESRTARLSKLDALLGSEEVPEGLTKAMYENPRPPFGLRPDSRAWRWFREQLRGAGVTTIKLSEEAVAAAGEDIREEFAKPPLWSTDGVTIRREPEPPFIVGGEQIAPGVTGPGSEGFEPQGPLTDLSPCEQIERDAADAWKVEAERLSSENTALLEILREIEWAASESAGGCCPSCQQPRDLGHSRVCLLGHALQGMYAPRPASRRALDVIDSKLAGAPRTRTIIDDPVPEKEPDPAAVQKAWERARTITANSTQTTDAGAEREAVLAYLKREANDSYAERDNDRGSLLESLHHAIAWGEHRQPSEQPRK